MRIAAMFETWRKTLVLLSKKDLNNFHNKTIWLKFLFTSLLLFQRIKELLIFFKRFILKFRISFREMATKNICEFLKLVNW